MWKFGIIFAFSTIFIIVSWFYNTHQKGLVVAFDHAKKHVIQHYHEDGPLINEESDTIVDVVILLLF